MPIRLTVVLCFYMRCRFSRAYLFGRARARNSQLPACRRCRLRACVSPTTRQARGTSALWCHGTDVGGVSLAAAWGSVARRKEHAIGRRKYFLLCELAIATSNKRQPALRPFGCLFSLSLSCYLALLLLLLYFDFQLLRKYLLFFH